MAAHHGSGHPLARQLETFSPLSEAAKQAIADLPMQVVEIDADHEILREGDRASKCFVILEGFVINFKVTTAGKRQILAYCLTGDIPDLQSLHLSVLDSSFATVTSCRLGFVQHKHLVDLCTRQPEIAAACWRWTLIMASIYREWVANVGQRDAKGRVAHLLCEVIVRMRAMGLVDADRCELPLTQGELADATGLSAVHVNRTLQELRRADLIRFKGTTLEVLHWHGLKKAGEFDARYLHLRNREAAAA